VGLVFFHPPPLSPMVSAWVWLCIPAAVVHPRPSQATKMLACVPVCRVLVVSRCVRDACRRVAECRSGWLGSGRKSVVSVCEVCVCQTRVLVVGLYASLWTRVAMIA
jgi:hypothetical protein